MLTKQVVASLRQVQEDIRSAPEQFDMRWFFKRDKGEPAENSRCTRCIGALLCLRAGFRPVWWTAAPADSEAPADSAVAFEVERNLSDGGVTVKGSVMLAGAMLLSVEPLVASKLFLLDDWPRESDVAYTVAVQSKNWKEAAEIACRRIDHFIEEQSVIEEQGVEV